MDAHVLGGPTGFALDPAREHETLASVLCDKAERLPDHEFLRFEDGSTFTYGRLHERANQVANALAGLGLKPGTTVGLMAFNGSDFLAAHVGISAAGMIEVPLNVELSGLLLAHPLKTARCAALIVSAALADRLGSLRAELTDLVHVIVIGDALPDLLPEAGRFSELVDAASTADPGTRRSTSDPSAIIFTSGTTGPAKGAIMSSRFTLLEARQTIKMMEYVPGEVIFTVFPMFHALARYCIVLPALLLDGTAVVYEKFSARRFWAQCAAEQATAMSFVGSLVMILMKQPATPADATHGVRKGFGSPAPAATRDAFRERFGVQLVEPFGGTEAGIATANSITDSRLGSCGRPAEYLDVEIQDEYGRPCPPGAEGEICLRSKLPGALFDGYYGMPEATVAAWRNLWFHTGDRGRMDDDGYFYFVDRMKDCIRFRGHNISSWEVEQAVARFDAVQDCAVIGVPSELTEEDVLVAVVPKPDATIEPAELAAFVTDLLPVFAQPRFVAVLEELPRNTSQRVLKYVLRERHLERVAWDRFAESAVSS
jgi:crotonobetaine/carnitine-CoA ligase